MQLKPLYRIRFTYPGEWGVTLSGSRGTQAFYYFIAEGRCEGRITGRYRGTNHPAQRVDGTFVPDFQGVIETDDGATILFDSHGYGRTYPAGRRQIVSTTTHISSDERYQWLNDVVCVGVGEVRAPSPDNPAQITVELVIDVAELIWEPLPE